MIVLSLRDRLDFFGKNEQNYNNFLATMEFVLRALLELIGGGVYIYIYIYLFIFFFNGSQL